VLAGSTGLASGAALATTAGAAATGAAACRRGGELRACSARIFAASMIADASPGFEMCERSIVGFVSTGALLGALLLLRFPLKYARTFSASSASIELECVFASVTPTAVRASRMDLLLTSSSRARSLIRTLLIRPFSFPLRP
jgi:hypothetical protein